MISWRRLLSLFKLLKRWDYIEVTSAEIESPGDINGTLRLCGSRIGVARFTKGKWKVLVMAKKLE